MRFVSRAEIAPMRCAAMPHLGPNHERGYFDTGCELPGWDPHVYFSVVAVEKCARDLGWVPPGEQEEAAQRVHELELKVDALEAELNESETVFDAIDILESRGYRARKKPGRKARQTESEAA